MRLLRQGLTVILGICFVFSVAELARADDPPGPDPIPIPPLPPIDPPEFPEIQQVPQESWQLAKCCIPGFWSQYWSGTCEPTTCRDSTPCGGQSNCATWVNGVCLDSSVLPPPTCAIVTAPGTVPPKYSCSAQICKVWRQDPQGQWYLFTGVTCKLTNNGSCASVTAQSCYGNPC